MPATFCFSVCFSVLFFFFHFAAAQTASPEDCREQYQKSPGYRQMSLHEKDLQDCKGKVGESFCISEKEEDFMKNCRAKAAPPKEPVEVPPPTPAPAEPSSAPAPDEGLVLPAQKLKPA
jgi:hypothetical protein